MNMSDDGPLIQVKLSYEMWYPVYFEYNYGGEHEIPKELWREYLAKKKAFHVVWEQVNAILGV